MIKWCYKTIKEKFTQTNVTAQGESFRHSAFISISKVHSRNFVSLKWWAPCKIGFWFWTVIPYYNFIYLIDNTRTTREWSHVIVHTYKDAQTHHSFRFISFFFLSWIGSFAKTFVWYYFCYLLFTFRIYHTVKEILRCVILKKTTFI